MQNMKMYVSSKKTFALAIVTKKYPLNGMSVKNCSHFSNYFNFLFIFSFIFLHWILMFAIFKE